MKNPSLTLLALSAAVSPTSAANRIRHLQEDNTTVIDEGHKSSGSSKDNCGKATMMVISGTPSTMRGVGLHPLNEATEAICYVNDDTICAYPGSVDVYHNKYGREETEEDVEEGGDNGNSGNGNGGGRGGKGLKGYYKPTKWSNQNPTFSVDLEYNKETGLCESSNLSHEIWANYGHKKRYYSEKDDAPEAEEDTEGCASYEQVGVEDENNGKRNGKCGPSIGKLDYDEWTMLTACPKTTQEMVISRHTKKGYGHKEGYGYYKKWYACFTKVSKYYEKHCKIGKHNVHYLYSSVLWNIDLEGDTYFEHVIACQPKAFYEFDFPVQKSYHYKGDTEGDAEGEEELAGDEYTEPVDKFHLEN